MSSAKPIIHKRNHSGHFTSFKQSRSNSISYKNQQNNQHHQESIQKGSNVKKQMMSQGQINPEMDFDQLQAEIPFIDYYEFDMIKEESGILVIYAGFNDIGDFAKNNIESKDSFENRLEEIVEAIQRTYPFIKVIVKKPNQFEPLDKFNRKYGLFEMYLCTLFNSKITKKVIYSKDLFEILPTVKIVVENINEQSELSPHILKTKYYRQNKPTLENVQISLHQKEKEEATKSGKSPRSHRGELLRATRSRDSSCTSGFPSEVRLDISSTAKNTMTNSQISLKQSLQMMKGQISYQNQTFSSYIQSYTTQQIAQANKIKRQNSSQKLSENNNVLSNLNNSSSQKNLKLPSKLMKFNAVINKEGVGVFQDIVTGIQNYELIIHSSQYTNSQNIMIDMKQLIEQQENKENLEINITLERNDISICDVIVSNNGKGIIQDSKVYVSDTPFDKERVDKGYESISDQEEEIIEISYDQMTRKYSLLAHPGIYYLMVCHSKYYTQFKQFQIKQGQNMKVDVDLAPITKSIIRLRAFDIINQCNVQNADVVIKDINDNALCYGKTNELGQIECKLKLAKSFKVSISKMQEYIYFQQIIEPKRNNSIPDNHYTIYMIPINPSLQKQFEVLVYFPHKKFDIDFSLKCNDGTQINKFNQKLIFNKSCINYYDEIEFKDTKLIEFSIQNIKNHQNYEMEIFSKCCITEQKYEEYKTNIKSTNIDQAQQQQLPLQKKKSIPRMSVNSNNYFLNSRITGDVKNTKPQVEVSDSLSKSNLPKIKTYDSDRSVKIFFIHKNTIQCYKEINTNIVLEPRLLGSFINYSLQQQLHVSSAENDENIQPVHSTRIPNQNLSLKLSQLDQSQTQQIQKKSSLSPIKVQCDSPKQGQILFSYKQLHNNK